MSRSYRHHDIIKSEGPQHRRCAKKWANRNVKNFEGYIPKGKWFRKLYPQYDMYEYIMDFSWESYRKWWWNWTERKKVNGKYVEVELTEKEIRAKWLRKYHYK